jgi:hypothetical protein
MSEFVKLLEENYDPFYYYGVLPYGGEPKSKCVAIEVNNPVQTIQDITRSACKRNIRIPELVFFNDLEYSYIIYWPLDEE